MLYSLHVCVCVGVSDTTTASEDQYSRGMCVMCIRNFLRGVPGGGRYAPPSYAQHLATGSSPGQSPEFFFGRFLLFLAVY